MELYQLKTFVRVAKTGSITRASDQLFLSQPAVSAHIKAIEDSLGLVLFERTPRGMSLTPHGQRLLLKAEQTLAAQRELLDEAERLKGRLVGCLHLGANSNSSSQALGHLLMLLAERYPEIEVKLQHGCSADILEGIRNTSLDAGFYNTTVEPPADLTTLEVGRFELFLAAPSGLVVNQSPLDWQALAALPWIFPSADSCCGRAMENLFTTYGISPERIINIDREDITRTLIAGGVGLGLLHAYTAKDAERAGEVELLYKINQDVRVLFACLTDRLEEPLLAAARSVLSLPE